MQNNNNSEYSKNYHVYPDLLFSILIFITPFISYPFIFEPIKTGRELYLISVVFLWLFVKSIFSIKNRKITFDTIDILLLLYTAYNILNFYFLSFYSFNYKNAWLFLSYLILFYIFKSAFSNNYKISKCNFFEVQLLLITTISLLEVGIALLQFFEIIKPENEYFNVTGSYTNPNFLGVHMTLACLVYANYLISKHKAVKKYKLLLFIPFIVVLILTESRASWISLLLGMLFLLITTRNGLEYLRRIKRTQIILFSLILGVFTICFLFYLYKLAPESVNGRQLIFKISLAEIKEKPIFGHGLFNFTSVYNEAKAEYFLTADRSWKEISVANYVGTAFNDYILLGLETGFIGLLFLLIIIVNLIKKGVNRHKRFSYSILISLLILGIFTSVIYNPIAMIFGCFAIAALIGKDYTRQFVIKNNYIIKIIFVGTTIISAYGLFWTIKKTKALAEYKKMVDTKREIKRPLSLKKLLILDQYISDDPYMEFTIGEELYLNNKTEKGIDYMKRATVKNNAPLLIDVLSKAYEHKGEIHKTENLLKKNTGVEPFKFKPKVNLMDFYGRTGKLKEQKETAQEIINLPVKIPSKEVDEYKKRAEKVLLNTQ